MENPPKLISYVLHIIFHRRILLKARSYYTYYQCICILEFHSYVWTEHTRLNSREIKKGRTEGLLKIISFLFLQPEMSPGIKSVVSRNETEIIHWIIKMTPAVVTWCESMPFLKSKLAGNMQEEQADSGKH